MQWTFTILFLPSFSFSCEPFMHSYSCLILFPVVGDMAYWDEPVQVSVPSAAAYLYYKARHIILILAFRRTISWSTLYFSTQSSSGASHVLFVSCFAFLCLISLSILYNLVSHRSFCCNVLLLYLQIQSTICLELHLDMSRHYIPVPPISSTVPLNVVWASYKYGLLRFRSLCEQGPPGTVESVDGECLQ